MAGLLSRLFGGKGTDFAWLDVADLKPRLGDVLLVDVRQPEEYLSPPGHLPGAVNVPVAEVPARARQADRAGLQDRSPLGECRRSAAGGRHS
jgi:rhodanese-related sulfurtransferase